MFMISVALWSVALVAPPCHQLHITRTSLRLPHPRAAVPLPMEPEPEPLPPAERAGSGATDPTRSEVRRLRGGSKSFVWTPLIVGKVALLFLLSGVLEIGGGWLIWQAVREGRPRWWAAVGSAVLVMYGFVPTLQPLNEFGRLYAVCASLTTSPPCPCLPVSLLHGCRADGGVFIALSYAWGWRFDGVKPDLGDIVGSAVALTGMCIALFWPRRN
tara:strand:+ start:121 stop:765 length:645 start_codon:yes stop_codon:yes gene_type:complete